MRNLSDAFEVLVVDGRQKAAIKHAKSTDETEAGGHEHRVLGTPRTAVPGTPPCRPRTQSRQGCPPPEVVDPSGLRVASCPSPASPPREPPRRQGDGTSCPRLTAAFSLAQPRSGTACSSSHGVSPPELRRGGAAVERGGRPVRRGEGQV